MIFKSRSGNALSMNAREKGKEEERLSIAKEMLLHKEPMHKIIKYSKLTEDQILKLKNEIINDEDQSIIDDKL